MANFRLRPGEYDARAFGVLADGSSDDVAAMQAAIDAVDDAGGGTIILPPGIIQLTAAPTTVNGSLAQLHLPTRQTTDPAIAIRFVGSTPPMICSVIGAIATPVGGTILRSTATSGAVFGGKSPEGGFLNFSCVLAAFEKLTIRLPDNPAVTGLDLGYIGNCLLRNVVVDTGGYDTDVITQPTTTTQYGIICPRFNNDAYTRLDSVMIVGCRTGIMLGEHANIDDLGTWGCYHALEVGNQNLAMRIGLWKDVHCRNGINVTASGTPHPRLDVGVFSIEYVPSGGSPTWQRRQADVIDSGNLLYGVCRYATNPAGGTSDNSFTKTGGTHFTCTSMEV
jgi:hypothetical protein